MSAFPFRFRLSALQPDSATPSLRPEDKRHRKRHFITALSVVCALAAVPSAPAVADARPSSLVGLWGAEQTFPPALSGSVTLSVRARTARAGGHAAPLIARNGALEADFGPALGRLRVHLSQDESSARGFWIQPATPHLGSAFATPIVFRVGTDGLLHGTIVPLPDQEHVYVSIAGAADGSLHASLRNPEWNLGRGKPLTVAIDGDELTFSTSKGTVLHAIYDAKADTLSVTDPDGDLNAVLTRKDDAHAGMFYARSPGSRFVFQQPPRSDDGWSTGSLQAANIDAAPIATWIRRVIDTPPTDPEALHLDSLLIARHGRLVLEEYFHGYDRDELHSLRSAGKTLTSILIGTAIDHGVPISTGTPVYAAFADLKPFANPDPRKDSMTLENLIDMTPGWACDDDADSSPGNEDTMQNQTAQPDWYKFTLDLPMAATPGTKAAYCTAGVNLAGGVLARKAQSPPPELFESWLARPLGIRRYAINLMPTGEAYMGGGIMLRPRDMLKFGQLYLDGGVWNGRRVVSKEWVTRSLAYHSTIHSDSTYGYGWWRFELKVGDRTYDEFEAGGNGGQLVMIVPALDLAVATTASDYGRFDVWYKLETQVLPKVILPAVK